jgi:hypothetical protein
VFDLCASSRRKQGTAGIVESTRETAAAAAAALERTGVKNTDDRYTRMSRVSLSSNMIRRTKLGHFGAMRKTLLSKEECSPSIRFFIFFIFFSL